MNTTTFTLTSVALGIMAGISAMHYHQVSDMVVSHDRLTKHHSANESYAAQTASVISSRSAAPARAQQPETRQEIPATTLSASDHAPSARESILLELLTEMRKEQKMLRAQLAETNREMSELTFRVDTHSDSFKPLRTDTQRPTRLDTTPLQTPIEGGHSVLPPIPRRAE